MGIVPDDTICEIKFTKPRPCICTQNSEPIVDDDGYLWYNEINKTLYVSDWDDLQGPNGDATWIPVGTAGDGGGGGVHVGENPPSGASVGDEWFCTKPDDLSLYVLVEKVEGGDDTWAAASPPVNLDGIAGDVANIDQTLMQTRADLFQTDNDLKEVELEITGLKEGVDHNSRELTQLRSRVGDTEFALEGKINNTGNNKVTSETDKEWRIQGEKKTFIKVNDTNQTIGIFNLQGATEDHHAISRGWVKEHTVQLKGNNKVESGWKVQSGDKTHLHVESGTTRIYYLQDPSHPQHPVNLQYADANYARKGRGWWCWRYCQLRYGREPKPENW